MHTVELENGLRIKNKNKNGGRVCTPVELENGKYIYVCTCVYGWRVLLVNIYVYYFVGNNGVLLRIKFMFKKYIYERIKVLNKKEVKIL